MLHLLCLAALLAPSPDFQVQVVDLRGKPLSGVRVQVAADRHFLQIIEQGKTNKKGVFPSPGFHNAPIRQEGKFAGLRVACIRAVFTAGANASQQTFAWSPDRPCPKANTTFVRSPGGRRAGVHPSLWPDTHLVFTELRRWDSDRREFVSEWEGKMEYRVCRTVTATSSHELTRTVWDTITKPYAPRGPSPRRSVSACFESIPCPCSD